MINKKVINMELGQALVLVASALIVSGQRPSFAGSRPIGFPELLNKTTTTPSGLEDNSWVWTEYCQPHQFGEVTTQRLPIEALGDRELVDRLSKLPIDKQPFWFINWQALEAERQKPQTYPQKPNPFLEPTFENTNSAPSPNANPGLTNNFGVNPSNTGNSNTGSVQIPNWKLQNPTNQEELTNKNGSPNEDKVKGTEENTPLTNTTPGNPNTQASTSISSHTINTSNADNTVSNNPKPVTANRNIDKFGHPLVIPESLYPEENEFEDIEIKKLVKTN